MTDYWEWIRERILLERDVQRFVRMMEELNPWSEDDD